MSHGIYNQLKQLECQKMNAKNLVPIINGPKKGRYDMLKKTNMLFTLMIIILLLQVACTQPSNISTDNSNINATETPSPIISLTDKALNTVPTVMPLPGTVAAMKNNISNNIIKMMMYLHYLT